MPPISLIVALMLAFGLGEQFPTSPVERTEIGSRLGQTAVALILAAGTSFSLGLGLASTIRRGGYRTSTRRIHSLLSIGVEVMNLGVYAWILFGLGWISVVRVGMGLEGSIIVDETLIFLPYLLAEVAGWAGLYPASRALSLTRSQDGFARYLVLRLRGAFGLVLPSMLIYGLGGDLLQRVLGPRLSGTWYVQILSLAGLGLLVLTISPAFIRLTLPTHRLGDGPLRDQLERQARRLGFRSTDILVWNTGGGVLNAGVTGLFPWFRYILLSDALVECLSVQEVAAVFGHEVGHIRHRHLGFFGFFMVGSTGVLALAFHLIETRVEPGLSAISNGDIATVAVMALALGILAAYFFFVFGALSRIFERQADVFGCRSISCNSETCPPHEDLDREGRPCSEADRLCPEGIRTFVEALRSVALLNGINPGRFSWRHGSINSRVCYLEDLAAAPDEEGRFQRRVVRYRLALALILIGSFVLSILTGAIETVVNS